MTESPRITVRLPKPSYALLVKQAARDNLSLATYARGVLLNAVHERDARDQLAEPLILAMVERRGNVGWWRRFWGTR